MNEELNETLLICILADRYYVILPLETVRDAMMSLMKSDFEIQALSSMLDRLTNESHNE